MPARWSKSSNSYNKFSQKDRSFQKSLSSFVLLYSSSAELPLSAFDEWSEILFTTFMSSMIPLGLLTLWHQHSISYETHQCKSQVIFKDMTFFFKIVYWSFVFLFDHFIVSWISHSSSFWNVVAFNFHILLIRKKLMENKTIKPYFTVFHVSTQLKAETTRPLEWDFEARIKSSTGMLTV